MLNQRQGQAKILSPAEIQLLLDVGFISARDKLLFMLCFYTACRISEARQIPIKNVLRGDTVLDNIVIPKSITKGKQGTRTVPIHPSLALFLKSYCQESLELLNFKRLYGNWSHLSFSKDKRVLVDQKRKCPKCHSTHIFNCGTYSYKNKAKQVQKGQSYLCKACRYQFRESQAVENQIPLEPVYSPPLGVKCSRDYGILFENPENPFLFPGRNSKGCLSLRSACGLFEQAFKRTGIVGAATHSCRRTALTFMHSSGVPLRVLQEISGHKDLGALQRYLEVSEDEIASAIGCLG